MAIIYALQGAGNKGKSTTLLTLCNKLESKNGKPLTPIEYTSRNKVKDNNIILTDIKENANNTLKKVGITSHGDEPDRIIEALRDFSSNNCDIMFCACHLSGSTVDAVNSFSNGNIIIFIQQVIQNNTYNVPNANNTMQNNCNDCMACHLLNRAGL